MALSPGEIAQHKEGSDRNRNVRAEKETCVEVWYDFKSILETNEVVSKSKLLWYMSEVSGVKVSSSHLVSS